MEKTVLVAFNETVPPISLNYGKSAGARQSSFRLGCALYTKLRLCSQVFKKCDALLMRVCIVIIACVRAEMP